jgi:hypothetical protein
MKEELVKFVSNLTPEQAEKMINYLPKLISLHEELNQPYLPEQTLQNQ